MICAMIEMKMARRVLVTPPDRGRLVGVDMNDVTPSPELWRPVTGYEGYYEVSDMGRVRSVSRRVPHRHAGKTRMVNGRVLRPTPRADGRLTVKLSARSATKTHLVHHLVITAFLGPRPSGLLACHDNGNCIDNRVVNLRWDTPSGNMRDRVRHGTDHNVQKVTCNRGHVLALPNLVAYRLKRGHRLCLACSRAHTAVHEAKEAGRILDLAERSDQNYLKIMQSSGSSDSTPAI